MAENKYEDKRTHGEGEQDNDADLLETFTFDPFNNGPDTGMPNPEDTVAAEEGEKEPDDPQQPGQQEGQPEPSENAAPKSEPREGGQQSEPREGANGQQQPQTPPPAQQPDEVTQLRQQVASMQQYLNSQAQQQQPQQGGQDQQQQQPEVPQYDLQIPDELWNAMNNDDPYERKRAHQAYNQAVAAHVHQRVQQEFQQTMQRQIPVQVQRLMAHQAAVQQVFNDFYGHHPDLNRPELRQLVYGAAQQVMQETGQRSWTPQLRDAVAQRVRQFVPGTQQPAPQQGQQQQQNGAVQPRAGRLTGSTPRSGGRGNTDPNSPESVESTLFGPR